MMVAFARTISFGFRGVASWPCTTKEGGGIVGLLLVAGLRTKFLLGLLWIIDFTLFLGKTVT